MNRRIMRGLALQKAMLLVAEGKLSDDEIAALLNVRLSVLEQTMKQPYFSRRVQEMSNQASLTPSKAAVAKR
jgi:hypothetical protein